MRKKIIWKTFWWMWLWQLRFHWDNRRGFLVGQFGPVLYSVWKER